MRNIIPMIVKVTKIAYEGFLSTCSGGKMIFSSSQFSHRFLPRILSLLSEMMLYNPNSQQPRDELSPPGLDFIQGSGPNMADIL